MLLKNKNVLMKQLTLWLVTCLLVACSHTAAIKPDASNIVKGLNDAREYRYIQLDNGLKILLIADGQADVASVSTNVMVGSGHDPVGRQGLAHFLEHMLFLGTSKYPDAEGFQKFLTDNGGQHNAYTALDHTNYFFSIQPQALEETVDRLAYFFKQPLFNPDYVEREKNAVHSEYQAGLVHEQRRQQDVLRELMQPEHPLAKFSVGSLETLSSEKTAIREDLLQFYQQHYVANNMSLAILAPRSLNELEAMVREHFADVRKDTEFAREIWPRSPFAADTLPTLIRIKPEKQLHELNVLFPMPAPAKDGRQHLSLLAHLLGDEGEGSLHALLQQQGLIDFLSAGLAWQYENGSALVVRIGLTEKGRLHKQQIVQELFGMIALLKQTPLAPHIYADIAKVSRLSFDYAETEEPLSTVISAANNLQLYPPEHVLDAPYQFVGLDVQQFQALFDYLTVENLLLIDVDQDFTAEQFSPFYQTPFTQERLSDAFKQALTQAKPNAALKLPAANPFIADDLRLLRKTQAGAPRLLEKNEQGELWYKPLDRFKLPQAVAYFSILQPWLAQDKRNYVLLDVYSALLNDELNALVYPAKTAELDFALYPHLRGLTLRIQGFSDKQDVLVEAIVQTIQQATFQEQTFQRIQQRLLRQWQNSKNDPPYRRVGALLASDLIENQLDVLEKAKILQQLSLVDVQQFAKRFRQDARLRSMTNGNLTEAKAIAMQGQFARLLSGHSLEVPRFAVKQLAQNSQRMIESSQADALYSLYLQGADNSVTAQAQWMLLAQMLSSPFFHEMRTEKQFGYVVFAQYSPQLTVPGLLFTIQSPVASVETLHQEVLQWREMQQAALLELSEQAFAMHKATLIQQLQEKDNNLQEEASRYWYELALGLTDFDRKQALVEALQQLDLNAWQQFVQMAAQSKQFIISTKAPLLPEFDAIESDSANKQPTLFLYQ